MPPREGNDWAEWRRHVLAELKRHDDWFHSMERRVSKNSTEIAVLKVKAGVWGLLGGAIPVVIALIIWFLSRS